jgi:plastocyanin
VAAVEITTNAATLQAGQTSQFSAIAVDADGIPVPNAGTPTWSSSAPSVVSVDAAGLVTAVTTGVATVSAVIQGKTGSRVVSVVPPGTGAVVTMAGDSFIPFEVQIRAGQQVFFEFPQRSHNVIFAAGAGAPADIQETRNTTVARTFNTAGQFAYDCTLHPGMSGLVTVSP